MKHFVKGRRRGLAAEYRRAGAKTTEQKIAYLKKKLGVRGGIAR